MGTTIVPPNIPQAVQSMTALQEANRIRYARLHIVQRMFAMDPGESHLYAADLLDDLPEVLSSMRLDKFLDRIRKCGPVQAGWLTKSAGANPVGRLGELSHDRRVALAAGLRLRGLSWAGKERAA